MRTSLTKIFYKGEKFLRKRAPAIFSVMCGCGVLITAVSAAKATPRFIYFKERAEQKKNEELTPTELFKIALPVYMPAIISGMVTITCMIGANVLNRQRQTALIGAYSVLHHSYQDYRKKLMELHGKEADTEIRNCMARENCAYHQLGLDVPDGKVIFYEEISGETFIRYEREVMDAEYHLNRNFALRGYAPLNEFYSFLGLPETKEGDVLGWSYSYGYSWIDFEHRLVTRDDGGPDIYVIDMVISPDADYLREWVQED